MIGTVHVYDAPTGQLAALGLTNEAHILKACYALGTFRAAPSVVLQPSDLAAEIALYRELEFHEGDQLFPSPRWN